MSIAISIYDIFAFTIPGLLYLLVFNEWLRVFGYSNIDTLQINFSSHWVPIILLAYMTGQLLDFVGLRLWVRLWYRVPDEERAYQKFLAVRPDEKTNFKPSQWSMLFTVIQREDRATAERIDRNIAVRILLRNVSFGLLIYSFLQFYLSFSSAFSISNFLAAICLITLSIASLRKSDYYNILLYSNIFQHAALYGKNLQEVLAAVRNKKQRKSSSEL